MEKNLGKQKIVIGFNIQKVGKKGKIILRIKIELQDL